MERTVAAKWFWPFVLAAALAAAVVIGLPAYVPSKGMQSEPEFRMHISVTAPSDEAVDRVPVVSLEPARIEVVGKRTPSILQRVAAQLPQRKPAS